MILAAFPVSSVRGIQCAYFVDPILVRGPFTYRRCLERNRVMKIRVSAPKRTSLRGLSGLDACIPYAVSIFYHIAKTTSRAEWRVRETEGNQNSGRIMKDMFPVSTNSGTLHVRILTVIPDGSVIGR
jgi:hypothetical protein